MIWAKSISIRRLFQNFVRFGIGVKVPPSMRFETIHPIFIVKITLILEFFGSGFTGLTVFVNSLIMSTINHFQSEIFHRTSVYVFTSMNYFLQWVFKLMFNQRLLLVDQSENELIRKQSWQQSNFGTSSRIGLLLCHS